MTKGRKPGKTMIATDTPAEMKTDQIEQGQCKTN